jgi:hypothetical protein
VYLSARTVGLAIAAIPSAILTADAVDEHGWRRATFFPSVYGPVIGRHKVATAFYALGLSLVVTNVVAPLVVRYRRHKTIEATLMSIGADLLKIEERLDVVDPNPTA